MGGEAVYRTSMLKDSVPMIAFDDPSEAVPRIARDEDRWGMEVL